MNNVVEENPCVPMNYLGLNVFNKTVQSQEIKAKHCQEERVDSVKTNMKFLTDLQEKRKEESKKKGILIPESKAELTCRQKITAIKDQNQIDAAALIYSYRNFAHVAYTAPSGDFISKNNRMDLGPKRLEQTIEIIKEVAIRRQFLMQEKVPDEQRASSMWAVTFSIFEHINTLQSGFPAFKYLFHERKQQKTHFFCAEKYLETKEQFLKSRTGASAEEKERCDIQQQKHWRTCGGETLFDQYFIPLCFIRRNAFCKNTQLDDLVNKIPLDQNDELTRQLIDVRFLSILEIVNLAMGSLEHLASLNPFPVSTVRNLMERAEEEKEAFLFDHKKKTSVQEHQLRVDLPLAANYELWPENAQYKSNICETVDVDKVVQHAIDVRKSVDEKKAALDKQEGGNKFPTPAEKLQYYRQQLENESECLSLQDGVHDTFSNERIDVYRSFLPANFDAKLNAATVVYSIMETKQTRFDETGIGIRNSTDALRQFFPIDFEYFNDKLGDFAEFCEKNKKKFLGSRENQYAFDKDLTARLFVKFLFSTGNMQHYEKVLSADFRKTICENFSKRIYDQMDTPNFRAWSAMVLKQLEAWLADLIPLVEDSIYWTRQQDGENVANLDAPKQKTFDEYCEKCTEAMPWLFETRQPELMPQYLARKMMDRSDDFDEFQREQFIIDRQYTDNCKRLWSVDSAIDYCNEKILTKKTFLTDEDQQIWCFFGKELESKSLQNAIRTDMKETASGTKMIWSICCEPILQGTTGFAVKPTEDPFCKEFNGLFAPNQKREMKNNPSVLMTENLWQLFRTQWSSDDDAVAPQVAQLGHMVVDAYMSLKKIPNVSQQPQNYNYLLSDHQFLSEETERWKTAVRFRKIIEELELFMPRMELGLANDILKIDAVSGNAIDEAHNSMLSSLGYSMMASQKRSFPSPLYEVSRPLISLTSLLLYFTEKLHLNRQSKRQNGSTEQPIVQTDGVALGEKKPTMIESKPTQKVIPSKKRIVEEENTPKRAKRSLRSNTEPIEMIRKSYCAQMATIESNAKQSLKK